MSEYEFTLKFAVASGLDRETLEARLFEAGCDDALLGIGQSGRMALRFTRAAASAREAVESALRDVRAECVKVYPTLRCIFPNSWFLRWGR